MRSVGDFEFSLEDCLGSGSFATVYKGRHKQTQAVVAIKAIDLRRLQQNPNEQSLRQHLDSEISIMRSLRHPNIVGLEDVITPDPSSGTLYMVLEFCGGGDLSTHIRRRAAQGSKAGATTGVGGIGERDAKYFSRQLAQGLHTLHSRGIVHRDLKPHNLLLSKPAPENGGPLEGSGVLLKIADFGFARFMDPLSLAATVCGSPLYMAPEVLTGQPYTDKADLWSVGAVLHEMLCGFPPFRARSAVELGDMVRRAQVVQLPKELVVSDECRKLVSSLLTVNTVRRIKWDDFLKTKWLDLESSKPAQPPPKPPQQQVQISPSPSPTVVNSVDRELPPTGLAMGGTAIMERSGASDSSGSFEMIDDRGRLSTPPPHVRQASQPVKAGAPRPAELRKSGGLDELMSPPPLPTAEERLADELQAWLRRVRVLLALGDLKVETEFSVEGLALFVHCIYTIRAALLTAKRRIVADAIEKPSPDSRLDASELIDFPHPFCIAYPLRPFASHTSLHLAIEQLKEKLSETVTKAEQLRTRLNLIETCVCPEKIVYDYALYQGKEGAVAEQMGNKQRAMRCYEDGLALLETILSTVPDQDRDVIARCWSRLLNPCITDSGSHDSRHLMPDLAGFDRRIATVGS